MPLNIVDMNDIRAKFQYGMFRQFSNLMIVQMTNRETDLFLELVAIASLRETIRNLPAFGRIRGVAHGQPGNGMCAFS